MPRPLGPGAEPHGVGGHLRVGHTIYELGNLGRLPLAVPCPSEGAMPPTWQGHVSGEAPGPCWYGQSQAGWALMPTQETTIPPATWSP